MKRIVTAFFLISCFSQVTFAQEAVKDTSYWRKNHNLDSI